MSLNTPQTGVYTGDTTTDNDDSIDRCTAVFAGEVPDRVPVCNFGNGAMLGFTSHTLAECRESPELVARIMTDCADATGADLFFAPIETKGIFMDLPGIRVKLPEKDQGSLTNVFFSGPEDVTPRISTTPSTHPRPPTSASTWWTR